MPPKADKIDPKTGEVLEETTTAVATIQEGGALVAADEFDYGDDAGQGFDNQTSDDVSVPFYTILQPGSPVVQAPDTPFKAGMVINNTTQEIFGDTKDGMTFVPAYTEHLLVEWVPRDNGGGLVGSHAIDSDLAIKVRADQPLGKYKHPDNGNDLIETFYVYGITIDANGVESPGVMSFSSTHIKPYKDWMFRARSVVIPTPNGGKITSKNMPLWAFAYHIKSTYISKNGFNWYQPIISWAGENAMDSRVSPKSDTYAAAKSVYEGVSSGKTKADTASLKRDEVVDGAPAKGDVSAEAAPY